MSDIGHNNPPPETLQEHIAALEDGLPERHAELLAEYARLEEACAGLPDIVADEDASMLVSDTCAALKAAERGLEDAQRGEKAPWLAGGRAVDDFFKLRQSNLENRRKGLLDRINRYLREKQDRERKAAAARAEEERQKAAQARKDAEAMQAMDRHHDADQHAQAAVKAENRAEQAERRAETQTTATRTESGATAFQRMDRIATITDRKALCVSLGPLASYLTGDEVDRALARAAKIDPWPVIPGVTFSEQPVAQVRGGRR